MIHIVLFVYINSIMYNYRYKYFLLRNILILLAGNLKFDTIVEKLIFTEVKKSVLFDKS